MAPLWKAVGEGPRRRRMFPASQAQTRRPPRRTRAAMAFLLVRAEATGHSLRAFCGGWRGGVASDRATPGPGRAREANIFVLEPRRPCGKRGGERRGRPEASLPPPWSLCLSALLRGPWPRAGPWGCGGGCGRGGVLVPQPLPPGEGVRGCSSIPSGLLHAPSPGQGSGPRGDLERACNSRRSAGARSLSAASELVSSRTHGPARCATPCRATPIQAPPRGPQDLAWSEPSDLHPATRACPGAGLASAHRTLAPPPPP